MSGTIKRINIDKLVNYYENPRHEIGSNEKDTLKKLFDSVGIQYMLNLAEDIQRNGLLGNQQVVVVYFENIHKYVVYEGNRRVAAIKLLLAPEEFGFLDKSIIEKAQKIRQQGEISDVINCYVTNEQEAFFIMERLHSGEDKGRGTKQWTPREKEAFKVRQSHEKNLSYLVDFYIKKYFDDFDITTILPFTTIQRIFNNREVKKQIGLDVTNESSFTIARMQLIIDASKWIVKEAEVADTAVTRLFNKARVIEDKLIPWIHEYTQAKSMNNCVTEQSKSADTGERNNFDVEDDERINNEPNVKYSNDFKPFSSKDVVLKNGARESSKKGKKDSFGGNRNLPYFFQGLNYSHLNPNDAETHGVTAVCRELQLFSEKKLVAIYPIATTFLVRSIIEQSIIYYSKKHNIQGQNKLIWENIKCISNLSKVIKNYNRNLSNYITNSEMRNYFVSLFGNYKDNVDPLNWVIHRPAEFQLDSNTLVELPRKGLLTLINFMLS